MLLAIAHGRLPRIRPARTSSAGTYGSVELVSWRAVRPQDTQHVLLVLGEPGERTLRLAVRALVA